jgi:predicted secreted protein with PEFG-CTERM motif
MKLRRIWVIAFSALLLIPFLSDAGFSEIEANSISTEKDAYAAGETISVIGHISTNADAPVLLQIVSPNGYIVEIDQIYADSENNFSVNVATSIDGLWKATGTYMIKATHLTGTFETQFDYGGMMSAEVKSGEEFESGSLEFAPVDAFSETVNVIQLEDYDLFYEITGAKILRIIPDVENNSLIITIETFSDGELKITLPKEVIDTTEGSFFVLVDGEETNHDASSTSDSWTLIIPFYNGSEEIEIIGTFVVPEFGAIAAIILAVAITSIIVLSAKSKLSLIPKV